MFQRPDLLLYENINLPKKNETIPLNPPFGYFDGMKSFIKLNFINLLINSDSVVPGIGKLMLASFSDFSEISKDSW